LLVVVGAVVASVVVDRAAPVPRPTPEIEWPAAIAPIAHRVEQIRGLRFRRAVPVRYVRNPPMSSPTLDLRARASIQAAIEPAVVFGLVDGRNDVASLVAVGPDAVAGVYLPRSRAIRIFVPERTDFARAVLAHELTHALEDQHFPANDRAERRSLTELHAQTAVVEGSAMLVERRYEEGEWTGPAWTGTGRGTAAGAAADHLTRWEWFTSNVQAPYVLGPAYIEAAIAQGDRTWDEIVAAPPLSDVVIVDPLANPGSVWGPPVPVPETGARAAPVPPPTALEVFLLLASRVGAAAALDVVGQSSGATMTTFDRDGRRCGVLALATTTPDSPALVATLDQWVAAAGAEHAARTVVPRATARPGAAVLTSCRGATVVAPRSVIVPLAQLGARNEAIGRALRSDVDPAALPCIARAVLDDADYRHAADGTLAANRSVPPRTRAQAYRRAARGCALRRMPRPRHARRKTGGLP